MICDGDVCVPAKSGSQASEAVNTVSDSPQSKQLKIDIVSDTVCPWCWVGKRRLEAALKQLPKDVKVDVDWHPFQLNPNLPRWQSENKIQMYKRKFGAARAEQMIPYMKKVGLEHGIKFSYGGSTGNTLDSHRMVEWAKKKGKQDEMVETLFKYYFEDEKDITDLETLAQAAADVGLDKDEARTFLKSDEMVQEVQHEAEEAAQSGISGVPNFVINGKYEIGGAEPAATFVQLFRKLGLMK